MTLDIQRKGWVGVGLQSAYDVPAANQDYLPFSQNTLHGVQEQIKIQDAHGTRARTWSSVPGKAYSQGDFNMLLDATLAPYLLVAALGTVQSVSLGNGVYRHVLNFTESNTPQYLTMISDRVKDREVFTNVAVDQLDIKVGTDLATAEAKLVGNFPFSTTSGTNTTASGNIFSFRNASLALGTTVSGAAAATNLKPHDLTVSIKNNVEIVHAHGSGRPRNINSKDYTVEADFMLYFENTTDRDNYYNQAKQTACVQFTGDGIGGGNSEAIVMNFFQMSFESFEVDSGLDNFYAEKVKMIAEVDNASLSDFNITVTNRKSLYI